MNEERLQQMASHGVCAAKHQFASFCYGRGWHGHKTEEAARKAASKDARRFARQFGGGEPQHLIARTDTGTTI